VKHLGSSANGYTKKNPNNLVIITNTENQTINTPNIRTQQKEHKTQTKQS
jgi:hypothetical protein